MQEYLSEINRMAAIAGIFGTVFVGTTYLLRRFDPIYRRTMRQYKKTMEEIAQHNRESDTTYKRIDANLSHIDYQMDRLERRFYLEDRQSHGLPLSQEDEDFLRQLEKDREKYVDDLRRRYEQPSSNEGSL